MVVDFIIECTAFSTVYKAIDIATGEIIFERREDDVKKLNNAGIEHFTGNFSVTKQVLPTGAECWSIADADGIQLVGWVKSEKIRKRGGKKSYIKLNPQSMLTLCPDDTVALVRLSPFIMVDGSLKDSRRRRPLSKKQVLEQIGYGRDKSRAVWKRLEDTGVIRIEEGVVFLDRRFLSRG